MGRESDGEWRDKYELTAQEKQIKEESMPEASESGKPVSRLTVTADQQVDTADQNPNWKIQHLLLSNFRWKKC